MTLTTTPMAMTDGIERMMKPLERIGVPAHEIAMMMSIALGLSPRSWRKQKDHEGPGVRGADFDTGTS